MPLFFISVRQIKGLSLDIFRLLNHLLRSQIQEFIFYTCKRYIQTKVSSICLLFVVVLSGMTTALPWTTRYYGELWGMSRQSFIYFLSCLFLLSLPTSSIVDDTTHYYYGPTFWTFVLIWLEYTEENKDLCNTAQLNLNLNLALSYLEVMAV